MPSVIWGGGGGGGSNYRLSIDKAAVYSGVPAIQAQSYLTKLLDSRVTDFNLINKTYATLAVKPLLFSQTTLLECDPLRY